MDSTSAHLGASSSTVSLFRNRLRDARAAGFHIRQEVLDGQPASWCEISGQKTVFLDSSQSAADQLESLNDALRSYRPICPAAVR